MWAPPFPWVHGIHHIVADQLADFTTHGREIYGPSTPPSSLLLPYKYNWSMHSHAVKNSETKWGMFVSEIECYKHQHHHQLRGVCPYCLTEILSRLSLTSNREIVRVAPSCSSSSSVSYSPASYSLGPSSGIASPDRRRRHQWNVSEVVGSIHYVMGIGNFSLRKSRSVAFEHGNFSGEVRKGNKKKGFWSKLLGLKGKKEIVMHSRTVRV